MITFSDLLNNTFQNYKKHFLIIAKLSFILYFIPQLILLVIQAFTYSMLGESDGLLLIDLLIPVSIGLGFGAISGILKLLLTFSIIKVLTLKRMGRELNVAEAISESSNHFFGGIGLSILTSLMIFGGLILFIIPGIILAIYLTFTLYAFIVDGTSYSESWSRSWSLVKDNWWRTLGYFMILSLIIILISLAFGLAIFPISILGIFITKFSFIAGYLIENVTFEILTLFLIPVTIIFGEQFYIALKKEKKI